MLTPASLDLGNRGWQRRDGLPIPLTAETGHGHCFRNPQHEHDPKRG
jgi:hypothetical protein